VLVAPLALTLRGSGAGCRGLLGRNRNRRLRGLGQFLRPGWLLPKQKRPSEKNGRQQERSVRNTSGHRYLQRFHDSYSVFTNTVKFLRIATYSGAEVDDISTKTAALVAVFWLALGVNGTT
jgi:hypothetical protein